MGLTVNIDNCMILGLILLFNSFVFKNCWCLSLNRNAKTSNHIYLSNVKSGQYNNGVQRNVYTGIN